MLNFFHIFKKKKASISLKSLGLISHLCTTGRVIYSLIVDETATRSSTYFKSTYLCINFLICYDRVQTILYLVLHGEIMPVIDSYWYSKQIKSFKILVYKAYCTTFQISHTRYENSRLRTLYFVIENV